MKDRRDVLWFVLLVLPLSWAVGAWWLLDERRVILVRLLMCVPALVAFGCAWAFRREPPRTAGLALDRAWPWVVAVLYPLAMIAAATLLAFAVRGLFHRPDFIVLNGPRWMGRPVGWAPWLIQMALVQVITLLPWLLVGLAYRWRWPERVQARVPGPLHHLVRAALFLPTFLIHGLPGELGEELGWRGYLVRRLGARPLQAALVTMPVWALFHLPVVFSRTQAGQPVQNAIFLASIGVAAVTFAALYLWSGSVWPCAVAHLTWNLWNPAVLGDVYGGHPGLFGGAVRTFNLEGLFGLILHGLLAAWFLATWARKARESAP